MPLTPCLQGEVGDVGAEGAQGERGVLGTKGKEGPPGAPGLVGVRVSVNEQVFALPGNQKQTHTHSTPLSLCANHLLFLH